MTYYSHASLPSHSFFSMSLSHSLSYTHNTHTHHTTVRLFNQGVDIIEVSDDGCGVPLASRPLLATAHATSKITTFHDIYSDTAVAAATAAAPNTNNTTASATSTSSSLPTQAVMGFRGEALFRLANLSSRLVVVT